MIQQTRNTAAGAAAGSLLVCTLILCGCSVGPSSTSSPPVLSNSQNVTLSINQAIASIATLNKAVALDAMALNGPGLVSEQVTNSILNYNKLVAQAVLSSEDALRGTLSQTAKEATVRDIFSSLHLPANAIDLLTSPLSNGPQNSTPVASLMTGLRSLQNTIQAVVNSGPVPARPASGVVK